MGTTLRKNWTVVTKALLPKTARPLSPKTARRLMKELLGTRFASMPTNWPKITKIQINSGSRPLSRLVPMCHIVALHGRRWQLAANTRHSKRSCAASRSRANQSSIDLAMDQRNSTRSANLLSNGCLDQILGILKERFVSKQCPFYSKLQMYV